MRKKILSAVIIISMVFNIAISHMAIFAECIDDIGEGKVTDEIKGELGLDETSQIDDSIWESVSSTSETDFVEDKEDDYDKNDVYEKECDEEQSTSIEQTDNETSYVEDEFSIEKVVATNELMAYKTTPSKIEIKIIFPFIALKPVSAKVCFKFLLTSKV